MYRITLDVSNLSKTVKQIRCFRCNGSGYKSFECPQKRDNLQYADGASLQRTAFVQQSRMPIGKYVIPVYINGDKSAHVAYRDTGADLSICDVDLLDENAYNGNSVTVQGVTGHPMQLRLANIHIQAPRILKVTCRWKSRWQLCQIFPLVFHCC